MTIEQKGQAIEHRGDTKNPFWLWDDLKRSEKNICYRLVHGGGMLGWNEKSLNAAHLKLSEVENLVKEGILRKASLFELAKEFIEDEYSCLQKEDLDQMGGFMALRNDEERDFFRSFDQAVKIVAEGETADSLEERYQINRKDFYDFIELF